MDSSPPQSHPDLFNTVTMFSKTLALVLFIMLPMATLYLGYQAGSAERSEPASGPIAQWEAVAPIPTEDGAFNKVTITTLAESGTESVQAGEERNFEFTNQFISLAFMYPNDPCYTVGHWENSKIEKELKSILVELADTCENSKVMDIRVIERSYCYLEWCFNKAQETFETDHLAWEFLGRESYADAGHMAVFENLYRAAAGEFVVYVVTERAVDLADRDDIVSTVFATIRATGR